MKKFQILSIITIVVMMNAFGAQTDTVKNLTASVQDTSKVTSAESSASVKEVQSPISSQPVTILQPKIAKYDFEAMPKDPLASAFFSLVIPGAGQIYNKEYLRGAIDGVIFYASLITIYYETYRWDQINTDTFYVQDVYNPTIVHMATAPKPDHEQVGLPAGEKVALGASLVLGTVSWIYGIIDSYNGANRYNKKLYAMDNNSKGLQLSLQVIPHPGITAQLNF
jgi:TM2 domain-containing membrane protein YozV